MEGQFLVRQIYDDEITYNLIGAAVEVLSELKVFNWICLFVDDDESRLIQMGCFNSIN